MRRLDILRAQFALRNLVVSRAYRSHGSMIHFEFGDLHERTVGRRKYQRGQYGLMVQFSAWEITRHRRRLSTNDARPSEIDRVIPLLIGSRVTTVRFAHRHSKIDLNRGFEISLQPDARLFSCWDRDSNWTLFHLDEVAFASDCRNHRLN